jgi:hypothetical protein
MNQEQGMLSRDDITARVIRMVTELCSDESCPIQPVLEQCVDDAISSYWPNKVETFTPLLAFRDVKECIRQGSCPPRTVMPS